MKEELEKTIADYITVKAECQSLLQLLTEKKLESCGHLTLSNQRNRHLGVIKAYEEQLTESQIRYQRYLDSKGQKRPEIEIVIKKD